MLHLKLVQTNQNYTREEACKAMELSQESFSTYFANYAPMQAELVTVGKKRVIYPGDVLNRRIQQLIRHKIAICTNAKQDDENTNMQKLPIVLNQPENDNLYKLTNFITYGKQEHVFEKNAKYTKVIDQLPTEIVNFNPKITYNSFAVTNASYVDYDWKLVEDSQLVRQILSQAGSLIGYQVKQLFINDKKKQLIAFTTPYLAQDLWNNCKLVGELAAQQNTTKSGLHIINPIENFKHKKPLFTVKPPITAQTLTAKLMLSHDNSQIAEHPQNIIDIYHQLHIYGNLLSPVYSYYYISAVIKYLNHKNFELLNKSDEISIQQHKLLDDTIANCDYLSKNNSNFNQPKFYQGEQAIDYAILQQAELLNQALYNWNEMWQTSSNLDKKYQLATKQLKQANVIDNAIFLMISNLHSIEECRKLDSFKLNQLLYDLPDLTEQFDVLDNQLLPEQQQKANQLLKDKTTLKKFLAKLDNLLKKYQITGKLTDKQLSHVQKLLLPTQFAQNTSYNYLYFDALAFCSMISIVNNAIKNDTKLETKYQKQIPDIVDDFLNTIDAQIANN